MTEYTLREIRDRNYERSIRRSEDIKSKYELEPDDKGVCTLPDGISGYFYSLLKEIGLHTGSNYFFGEGEDIDYVITFDELYSMRDNYNMAYFTNNVGDYFSSKDDIKFGSMKFYHEDDIINAIIINEKHLYKWKRATELTKTYIEDCSLVNRWMLRETKELRIKIFEHFFENGYKLSKEEQLKLRAKNRKG